VSQTVTFDVGETIAMVTVPTNDDAIAEINEMFVAQLSGNTNPRVTITQDSAMATIVDNDGGL